MKYQLINPPNPIYNTKKQILINRGLDVKEIDHYMNLTDLDINNPECFGEDIMRAAAMCFTDHLDHDSTICVIVDADCDGYTSSAILINYIYDLKSEAYINSNVNWYLHEGKQHGLSDCMDWIEDIGPDLVIIPDAGSNDIEQLQKLEDADIDVIILDHHEIEEKKKNEVLQITPLDFWKQNHPHLYLINSQI